MRVQASTLREFPDGRVDVDVFLYTAEGLVNGEVTLWPDEINGGYGSCGSPAEVWADGLLLNVLGYDKHALSVVECCAARAVESGQLEEDEV